MMHFNKQELLILYNVETLCFCKLFFDYPIINYLYKYLFDYTHQTRKNILYIFSYLKTAKYSLIYKLTFIHLLKHLVFYKL